VVAVTAWRALDPSERYFWLLDHLGPMNIAATAELERRVTLEELGRALATVQARHPLLRARVQVTEGAPHFVEASGPLPLEASDGASGWLVRVAAELDSPFSHTEGPFIRCLLYTDITEGHSVVALVVHHAVCDAHGLVHALRDVLRTIESGERPGAPVGDLPPALHETFPDGLRAPRAVVEVLREIQSERAHMEAPGPFPFHDREAVPQVTRLHRLVLAGGALHALVDRARERDSTVNGIVAASALASVADLFGTPGDKVLSLATPTNLRRRVEPPIPDDVVVLAIGLLCTPYVVPGDVQGDLAARISAQTRREVARGESHLFYRIARSGSYAATQEGLASFASWVSSTPANVGVSNLGVIGDTGDPEWVRSLAFSLSPSANQPCFVAVTTYRDRLTMDIATDANKLPDAQRARLVDAMAERTGATPACPDGKIAP
jgi:hypothetical protein